MCSDGTCSSCQGTGIGDPHSESSCPQCNGRGYEKPRGRPEPDDDGARFRSSSALWYDDEGFPRLPNGWEKLPEPAKTNLWRQYQEASAICRAREDRIEKREREAAYRLAATPKPGWRDEPYNEYEWE
jgi:hypothetical protein